MRATASLINSIPASILSDCSGRRQGRRPGPTAQIVHWASPQRGRVFERIANGIANDRGSMQWRALLLEIDFDQLLGVVPGTAGIGHVDCLEQPEDGD